MAKISLDNKDLLNAVPNWSIVPRTVEATVTKDKQGLHLLIIDAEDKDERLGLYISKKSAAKLLSFIIDNLVAPDWES